MAAVDVDDVAQRLEDVEADAERERHPQRHVEAGGGQAEPVHEAVVAVDAEVEVLEEGEQRQVRANRDDHRCALAPHPCTVRVEPFDGASPLARPAERDDEPRDVIDEGGEEEQEREQRVRPPVEHEAQQRENEMLGPTRNGVVQQQCEREEVEKKQKRAEDHARRGQTP